MNNYMVISADCHAGLPSEQYREWLDPDFRDAFDQSLAARAAMEAELAERGLRNEEFAEEWEQENAEGLRGGWDAGRRDQELDADGIVGEVIFPDADAVTGGASAPFGAGLAATADVPIDLLMAGAKAHNRWLAELCNESPHRRAGVAIVPIFDVDAAVAEISRARESSSEAAFSSPRCGSPTSPITTPSTTLSGPPARISRCRCTFIRELPTGHRYGDHVGIYVAEVRWWSTRPLWFLLWAGTFERFPSLTFVTTECGAFWAPDLLWTSDIVYDREHAAKKLGKQLTDHLSMRPSEYFDRNCYIGASNTRRRELARRYEIGIGNIMWGNDFPHPEGTWPHTKEWLSKAFSDIPVDETQQILGSNAAECYHFDTKALQPLTARFGPTPEELGQRGDDLQKWEELAAAGRPWLTGKEALDLPIGD